MKAITGRRWGLLAALVLGLGPVVAVVASQGAGGFKTANFQGKVVPLAKWLDKQGAKLDPDAAPQWFALVADDGKVYPLVKDDGSRMFFKDARLLNRPMRLTGRLVDGSPFLQVTNVHSLLKGKLHEVYYWCDICSIRRNELNKCECCGDIMVLRETPVKECDSPVSAGSTRIAPGQWRSPGSNYSLEKSHEPISQEGVPR